MKDFKVDMNEYMPLRDVVFHTLRRAILMGELEPGERLMELALTEKLGVSRTPIREAIRKLELDGLVVMVPRRGAAVAHITEKDLQDVLEVRCALEELAVTLACERMDEGDLDRLEVCMKEFEVSLEGGDLTDIAQKDVEFHDIIFQSTDNNRLVQMLNNLREQMYRYRVEYLKNPETYGQLMQEHEEILRCLRSRDCESAKKALHGHIENQFQGISRLIRETGKK